MSPTPAVDLPATLDEHVDTVLSWARLIEDNPRADPVVVRGWLREVAEAASAAVAVAGQDRKAARS